MDTVLKQHPVMASQPEVDENLTGAQAVVRVLKEQGVEVVYGIPGGAVLPLYDALHGVTDFDHVLVRHEQAAALAADGYARVTGKPGVCIATSGPGATNLVTGLANAYMDSIPVVAITGNVPRSVMGTDAFQETDCFGVTLPVTKHNYVVMDPMDLPYILREAFALAVAGRPGPVLVDIPRDVLQSMVPAEAWQRRPRIEVKLQEPDPELIAEAARQIAQAARPVLYAGGGVITANAHEALVALAEAANLPTTTTLMALGSMPGDHPLFMGMPGMHGTYTANQALTETDCLIAVGARFDDRVTGRVADFAPNATVIHIDADASEHGKVKETLIPIVADARLGLEALAKAMADVTVVPHDEWLDQIKAWQAEHPYRYDKDSEQILPQMVIEQLEEATKRDAIVVTGVGQHQMWAAMFYKYKRPRQLLTSGGLGTMGYCMPAGIGAQMADPDAQVICVDGDASFQMNVQELIVVAEKNLPLKMFILNNKAHGMVRQWQTLFYGGRLSASVFDGQPDFVKLAEAYGVKGMRVDNPADLPGAIQEALAHPGPVVMDIIVKQSENVLPIVPPGAALKEMITG